MKTPEEIDEEVMAAAHRIWDLEERDKGKMNIPFHSGTCSKCWKPFSRCISIITTGELLCPRCWCEGRREELVKENRPKLDVKDFSTL